MFWTGHFLYKKSFLVSIGLHLTVWTTKRTCKWP